jgi:hypothetical protein
VEGLALTSLLSGILKEEKLAEGKGIRIHTKGDYKRNN